jgi:acetyl-CoA synthetase
VEAAAIGVPHAIKGETIVVVCTIRRGETDDEELRAAIARRVVEDLGKTLRPEAVAVVPALPKTRSGKIMRRVVRAAWLGLDPGDLSALDDPATIDAIRRAGPVGVANA